MEERFRFVLRLLEGEEMSAVCREFGISRKTGYKIYERYKDQGLEALTDRSRRPFRYGNQLPVQLKATIVRFKREKPHWGARKIREMLLRQIPNDVRIPAVSTVHAVLDRHGLVSPMGPRRTRAKGTALSSGQFPNDLWCVDFKGEFKGEFMLGSRKYCYPLTVTDYASRSLFLCEALESTKEEPAMASFDRLFRERGLLLALSVLQGRSPYAEFGDWLLGQAPLRASIDVKPNAIRLSNGLVAQTFPIGPNFGTVATPKSCVWVTFQAP